MNILLVEDDRDLAANIGEFLESAGHRVDYSTDGLLARRLCSECHFDAIILDVGLPGINGLDLCRWLRTVARKNTPVLMLTAKQLTPTEAQEYGIYIEDYVLKPITHRELYDAIEHVLSRRQAIKSDMDMARQSGFDTEIISEYARLSKSIDVNKRLMKILETTYNFNDSKARVSDDISRAIKSMEMNIKFQESRLQQIKGELSGSPQSK